MVDNLNSVLQLQNLTRSYFYNKKTNELEDSVVLFPRLQQVLNWIMRMWFGSQCSTTQININGYLSYCQANLESNIARLENCSPDDLNQHFKIIAKKLLELRTYTLNDKQVKSICAIECRVYNWYLSRILNAHILLEGGEVSYKILEDKIASDIERDSRCLVLLDNAEIKLSEYFEGQPLRRMSDDRKAIALVRYQAVINATMLLRCATLLEFPIKSASDASNQRTCVTNNTYRIINSTEDTITVEHVCYYQPPQPLKSYKVKVILDLDLDVREIRACVGAEKISNEGYSKIIKNRDFQIENLSGFIANMGFIKQELD